MTAVTAEPSPSPAVAPTEAPVVVVMGVSGCGKSTVGLLLAERLGVPFLEGDGLHPAANVAKMSAGQPLDDDDRRPWLDLVGQWLAGAAAAGGGVASCSALARRYRDQVRARCAQAWFLHLDAGRDLVVQRVTERPGHFLPSSLVDSQLATLQPLGTDEAGFAVGAGLPPEQIVAAALAALTSPR